MKWGIIGAGRVAERFAVSLKQVEGCELYAVSCRTQEKADLFANRFGAEKAYEGFEKIVNDSEIDAVYVATPHMYHYEWIVRCLNAHKAVLVEKPACMSTEEMNQIIRCAEENSTLFMEAMKTRFVPAYRKIKETDEIGRIVSVYASLCNAVPEENILKNYLGDPASGGVLTDTGIYAISWVEDYLKGDCRLKHLYTNVRNGVNYYTRAVLDFSGKTATVECAMDRKKPHQAVITGTDGCITADEMHRPVTAYINSKKIEMPYEGDDFTGEIEHFRNLYEAGKTESRIMSHEASLRCQKILETIEKGMHWDLNTVELLEKEEEALSFEKLNEEDLKKIGEILITDQDQYERDAAVRIIDEEDGKILFEHLPEDKSERNFRYMDGKRECSKLTGHSSFATLVRRDVMGEYRDELNSSQKYCISGGSFPIKVNHMWKYTILVSGLHEGEDHELIVNALYRYKNMDIPDFPYYMV